MNGRERERKCERKGGGREKEGVRTPCRREGKTDARSKRECLHSRSPDYTKGIFQSIGFKEFHAYLILSEKERASEKVSSERKMARRYELRPRSRDCRSLRHGSCFRLGSPGHFSAVKMHRATCNVVYLAVVSRYLCLRSSIVFTPFAAPYSHDRTSWLFTSFSDFNIARKPFARIVKGCRSRRPGEIISPV